MQIRKKRKQRERHICWTVIAVILLNISTSWSNISVSTQQVNLDAQHLLFLVGRQVWITLWGQALTVGHSEWVGLHRVTRLKARFGCVKVAGACGDFTVCTIAHAPECSKTCHWGMTAFDRPEATLCDWQDVKIHEVTNTPEPHFQRNDLGDLTSWLFHGNGPCSSGKKEPQIAVLLHDPPPPNQFLPWMVRLFGGQAFFCFGSVCCMKAWVCMLRAWLGWPALRWSSPVADSTGGLKLWRRKSCFAPQGCRLKGTAGVVSDHLSLEGLRSGWWSQRENASGLHACRCGHFALAAGIPRGVIFHECMEFVHDGVQIWIISCSVFGWVRWSWE